MTESSEVRVVACNYAEGVSEARPGALCYVLLPNGSNAYERVFLLIRSRSGRWIEKWENVRRLTGFRMKTIPRESPLWSRLEYDGRDDGVAVEMQAAAERARTNRAAA